MFLPRCIVTFPSCARAPAGNHAPDPHGREGWITPAGAAFLLVAAVLPGTASQPSGLLTLFISRQPRYGSTEERSLHSSVYPSLYGRIPGGSVGERWRGRPFDNKNHPEGPRRPSG